MSSENGAVVDDASARLALDVAVALVLEAFDRGVFVRATEGDGDPAWAIKLLPYLRALAVLQEHSETTKP